MTNDRVQPAPIEDPTISAVKLTTIDAGRATSQSPVGTNILQDESKSWAANIHVNRLVKVVKGTGKGQTFRISGNSVNALVINGTWTKVIGVGDEYVIVNADFMQMLRGVFGGGANISVSNPLETS